MAFEIDPEIAAMMDSMLQAEPVAESVADEQETEVDTRTAFEKDQADLYTAIASWKAEFEKGLVQTHAEVPAAYAFGTNTTYSPYSAHLHEALAKQRAGAKMIFCRQAFRADGQLIDESIAMFAKGGFDDFLDRFILGIMPPQSPGELAREIADGNIYPFYFDPVWRSSHAADHLEISAPGFLWAEQNSLDVPAYMTSKLLDDRLMSPDERTFYELLATEVDADGHRKYLPLSIEQFAGLVAAGLHQKAPKEDTQQDE